VPELSCSAPVVRCRSAAAGPRGACVRVSRSRRHRRNSHRRPATACSPRLARHLPCRPRRSSRAAARCRRDRAGRCRARTTRSSGESARRCLRRHGSGTHSEAWPLSYAGTLTAPSPCRHECAPDLRRHGALIRPVAGAKSRAGRGRGGIRLSRALDSDRGLRGVVIKLAAAQHGNDRPGQRHRDGDAEDDDQAVVERA
jgi:hypothetical protein